MLKEERQRLILEQVHLHNRVLLTDLSEQLDVSIDTVRRDVKELDQLKKLRKVHGGAISRSFLTPTLDEPIYLQNEKQQIAAKAVKLLKEDQVVLMSGGTTNLEVVKFFPRKISLTVFTPSLQVASELMNFPNVEVIFLGGKLLHEAKFAVGGMVTNVLSQIKVDLCFLGTGYLDPISGLTEFDWEVVQVKRAMIAATKKLVLLTVSNKLFSVQRYKTCDLNAVDILITELEPDSQKLHPFREYIDDIL
ncbi:DeoR/GlpR family DNA-binding transcription regulator [Mongoliitalea lutea]|uniref:DeoR family transcriptional regulator n=1 Tax=Mongoliitalea lutea TaxID=849756 RepID=A0A8J3G471_9BACT|nr:DeoR/GlpR family DNA-binding transcription regulator [Mongoliitalea lutea]GHB26666.1 DeoR family transcriptional regulator [Mongoliitalea lutea]